jgi:flagellar hook-associated protein 2
LDKMEQKKQTLEWQRDAYREMNALLLELRNMTFDMRLQGTYRSKSVSSNYESIVKVTANGNAPVGQHTVKVTQIAKGVFASSTQDIASSKNSDGTIKKLSEQFGISGTITFSINGESFSFDTTQKTIYDVVSEINLKSYEKNLGITASYDSTLNRFFINTKSTGSTAKIDISEDINQNFFKDHLKFNMTADGDAETNDLLLQGQDAIITYNGSDYTMSTNQFTINGINFDLQSANSSQDVTLNVTNNTDAVFDKIVKFIGKYNEVIDKINKKLSEQRYRDYPPLTEAQKEEMSEKQIELWEGKAKSGLLKGDSILSSALAQFRNDFATAVSGLTPDLDSMFDIGLTTGSYETKGQIIINESKLKEALNKDPDKVMQIFTKTHDTDYKQRGLAVRLYESIDKYMEQLTEKAGSNNGFSEVDESVLGTALDELEEDMAAFEKRLRDIEDRYWRQFTAMEKAIQRANMQSGWLMQQFGGGQ